MTTSTKTTTTKFFQSVMDIHHGNYNMRTFHVKRQLMRKDKEIYGHNKTDYNCNEEFEYAYRGAQSIYRCLMQIDGIKAVGLSSYEISIEKGKAYEWKEIMPKISTLLLERF